MVSLIETKDSKLRADQKSIVHYDIDERIHSIDKEVLKEKVSDSEQFSFDLKSYIFAGIYSSSMETSLDEKDADHVIENFTNVPVQLEKFFLLGFFICLDVFLYALTFLPIRCVSSIYLLWNDFMSFISIDLKGSKSYKFHRNNLYDLMKGLLLIGGCIILCFLDMSRLYHLIRGQTLIKLYVFSSILEVFDRLLSSFGQDAFTSLYSQTRNGPREIMALSKAFIVVYLYVISHSVLYFIQTAALTVAVNSSDQAFLTVVLLNNFTEVKSFVFKKFDKKTLFRLSCGDITERFQTILFITIIIFATVIQADSPWHEVLPSFNPIVFLLIIGECSADWIKHCFITKFNSIEAVVYEDYSQTLRNDILRCYEGAVDHTSTVSKSIGLAQVPLACVFIRYLTLAAPIYWPWLAQQHLIAVLLWLGLGFGLLVCLKVLLGASLIVLAGTSKKGARCTYKL